VDFVASFRLCPFPFTLPPTQTMSGALNATVPIASRVADVWADVLAQTEHIPISRIALLGAINIPVLVVVLNVLWQLVRGLVIVKGLKRYSLKELATIDRQVEATCCFPLVALCWVCYLVWKRPRLVFLQLQRKGAVKFSSKLNVLLTRSSTGMSSRSFSSEGGLPLLSDPRATTSC
jgi:hypothetical protein